MTSFESSSVEELFLSYPDGVRQRLLALRELIFEAAERIGVDGQLQECICWGEPSYLCKDGSAVRMNWKSKDAKNYRMLFHRQTTLVETFRLRYASTFHFEGNRAIRFSLEEEPDF